MQVIHISEPGAVDAAVEAIRSHAILVQLPTVYVLLAPATHEGASWLDEAKQRQPHKNYGTAIGDVERFYEMITPGTLAPELDGGTRLNVLTGAFIRCTVAAPEYDSVTVRAGTHQGVLLPAPHRGLFMAIERGLADMADPAIMAGHTYTAPLCTSCNMSGHPDGSIVHWRRARQFAIERNIPLVVRGDAAVGQAGSYPIFALSADAVSIERDGPRLEELKAALPARLFAPQFAASTA
jgi:tRNA A37 threonylcarbamoyladenosine synthetase subunit TsaC/SUA5/YrdC